MIRIYKFTFIGILLAAVCTSACAPTDYVQTTEIVPAEATQGEEQQEMTKPEITEQPVYVSVDLSEKRIEIPENHILSIYKDTYAEQEKIYDRYIIDVICDGINNSEIVQMYVGFNKLITMDNLKLNYVQYPILLETAHGEEYVSVNKLAQAGTDFYVQLMLVILPDQLKHAGDYEPDLSSDGKQNINCIVKSEKLYYDILNFWGEKVTISDIQNPDGIKIFYKDPGTALEFTQEDMEGFTLHLPEDSIKVFDDHSFGITIAISMPDQNDINIYYADDGCAMFQIDGESYNLKSDGKAAAIVRKYFERLEIR